MNIRIKTIKQAEINKSTLSTVISLKQQHWNYSFASQFEWINKNLCDHDLHVCLFFDKQIIAYLDLIQLKVFLDEKEKIFYGVGNVCVDKNHLKKGWGLLLISYVNCMMKEQRNSGILLCQDELVNFYQRCGWLLIDRSVEVIVAGESFEHNTMVMNCKSTPQKTLRIDKNF